MRWPVIAVRLLLTSVLATSGVIGITGAVDAAPTPVTSGFDNPNVGLSLYGDFLEVGNSSLRCPVAGEPLRLGGGPAQCASATRRESALPSLFGSNNDYYLRLAGRQDATTFDQSTATFRIPQGTTVRYAQLDWGGNTGAYQGTDRRYCATPIPLLTHQATPPPAPAADGPRQQQVRMTVDAAVGTSVSEVPLATVQANYASSTADDAKDEMYSDWADVTPDFAALGADSPVSVTVANVWAASGFGCAAGWSLTVVYGSVAPQPAFPALRQFDVYTTHLREGAGADQSFTLPEPSVAPDTAHVELGVTAYDGDWNNSGDSMIVDGTSVADPCDGSADNFFTSCADGAVDPLDAAAPFPNNMSVDAKVVTPTVRPEPPAPAPPTADSPTTDPPAANPPAANPPAADPPTANPATADPPAADAPQADRLAADPPTTDPPTTDPPTTDPPTADPPTAVSPAATAGDIDVELPTGGDQYLLQTVVVAEDIHPSVTETVALPTTTLHEGDTATYTISGANDGDIPLTDVTLADSTAGDCANTVIGDLAPGQTYSVTCHVPHAHSFDDVATVTAHWPHDQSGLAVSVSASFSVSVLGPQLAITQSASPTTVRSGDPVTVTFTVTNNGQGTDGPLTDVAVTEQDLAGCTVPPIASIAVGESATATCTTSPEHTVTSTATASARDATGATVSATSDPVTLTVANPALTISEAADPSPVGPDGMVTFTVTVHNTGDVPLSVRVADTASPECAFSVTDPALPVRAARSQTCTVHAPNTVGPFTDTATYTATPSAGGTAAAPLTGHAQASVSVESGAPLTGGNGTTSSTGGSGGGGGSGTSGRSGSSTGGGGSTSGGGASSGGGPIGLAWTGVEVLLPVLIGVVLLAGGAVFVVVSRRRARRP
jgi:uncharacterized repeat protein (TIGR01451 family)